MSRLYNILRKIITIIPKSTFSRFTGFDNVSMSSGTSSYTLIGSVTVPAGHGIVQGCVNFGDTTNATGSRRALISTTSSSPSSARNNSVIAKAADGGVTILQVSVFVQNSTDTTYYLFGMQSSGNTLSVNASIGYWIESADE